MPTLFFFILLFSKWLLFIYHNLGLMHFSIMKTSRDVIRFMYFQMCLYTCHYTSRDFCDWKIYQPWIMINEKFSPLKKIEELLSMCNTYAKTLEVWWKNYFTYKPIILIVPLCILWLENVVISNYNGCKLLIFFQKNRRVFEHTRKLVLACAQRLMWW